MTTPDRAIEQFRKALELDPHNSQAQMGLGYYHVFAGKLDERIRACETAALLFGRHPTSLATLGAAYALAGRISEAQKIVEELEGLAVKTYVAGSGFAVIYSILEKIDKALDWFEKAIEERDASIAVSHLYPTFDPLRSHPRFHALMRKMNLEP